ncbi:probable disease resistance protein At4g27220 [Hevea brasiliensis]|uniref:probable disease resistance protein At4g27220 n=1 Tax=Hevea brasiliensis TaxID=3981 RepID=UPI0025D475CD|nr:probable disease resistance protein At4g27220 [Hevea brasiliensis]
MINLRFLWITTNQKYLPTGGIGCLKSLRFLFIDGCDNLEYLFEDMQGLKMLRRLIIDCCESLISLPQSIKCLMALETLCIQECENLDLAMEEGEDNQFPTQFSLQKLELRNLPKLVEFPQWRIRGSTNSLKVMKVKGCRNLRELPECLQNMASLQEVQIKNCPQLNNDPIRKADPNTRWLGIKATVSLINLEAFENRENHKDSIAMTREQKPLTEQLVDSNPLAMVPWQAHGLALHSTGPSKCLKVPRLLKQSPKCKLLGDLVGSSPKFLRGEQKEDDILAALRLSYEHLPSYLKSCFAYCSIFPKDNIMDDIELVYLWMANGLVQSSNENQELEDIGLRYFKELCSRWFEVLPTSIGDLKHLKYLSLVGNYLIRRLPNSICKLQSLQVLLLTGRWSLEELPKDIKCDNIEYLFEDIQGLKMLRRLIVRCCRCLKSLPQSIKCLTALETLCINECENLDLTMEEGEENQYPTQFKLQKLELGFLPQLVEFPEWLVRGSTNSLKVVKVEGCRNLRELPECIQNMASLQELQIECCPQLKNDPYEKQVRINI